MTAAAILADPAFRQLKEYVLAHTGLSYYADKDEDLATRLGRRLAARCAANCSSYLTLLLRDGSGQEHDALAGELTIGETYFFRQEEHFRLLREIIVPGLLESNAATRKLRFWSAGCATGAEPYSIALLLKLHFAAALKGWDIDILGTDINPDFLQQAKTARFGKWALRDVSDEVKARCFERDGKYWNLRPEYRTHVHFGHLNLVGSEPYPGLYEPFDVIFCRNVLIYFSAETIRTVAARLHESLSVGGWLLVGHAEPSARTFSQFEVLCRDGVTAYRRELTARTPAEPVTLWQWTERPPQPHARPAKPVAEPPLQRNVPVKPDFTASDIRMVADRGAWGEAEHRCRALIEADPLCAANHYTLGLLLFHAGDRRQAEAAFRRAIYLDRNFALAHYHLGTALERADGAKARKSFENVLELLDSSAVDDQVPEGDGMTAGELRELVGMHLSLLSSNRG